MNSKIIEILNDFANVGLEDTSKVSLMKRVDTKFIISRLDLNDLLLNINDYYHVLEVNYNRIQNYNSQYFDTDNFQFYLDHHNGKQKRKKIRIRKYNSSNICFLEVKNKNTKGQTIKNRIKVDDIKQSLSVDDYSYIRSVIGYDLSLKKSASNDFDRITLISKQFDERLTIDLNIKLEFDSNIKHLDSLVIIELKQNKLNRYSPLFRILKEKSINPLRISKYCISLALLNKQLKNNLFKFKIKQINKLRHN
jgi:hypothetical protein